MGRVKIENPRSEMVSIRFSEEDYSKLGELANYNDMKSINKLVYSIIKGELAKNSNIKSISKSVTV